LASPATTGRPATSAGVTCAWVRGAAAQRRIGVIAVGQRAGMVVVGAPAENDGAGAAYAFVH
jgi:hypothetical protein